MEIAPQLVARPPKAKAIEVTCAAGDMESDPQGPEGLFRPVVTGPLPQRKAALDKLLAEGLLQRDAAPGMFIYRIVHEGTRWVGVVCAVKSSDVAGAHGVGAEATESHAHAHAELAHLAVQHDLVVIQCALPDEIVDLHLNDTNERPAYHFVAGAATHSAWLVHDTSGYMRVLGGVKPQRVLRGAARVVAAHAAGVPVFAVITRDLPNVESLPPALTPRSGLFVALTTLGA